MTPASIDPRSGPPCPLCGRPLDPTEVPGPPWLCPDDSRAWWPTELTSAARDSLRPALRDYGIGEAAEMVALATQVHAAQAALPTAPPTEEA